jgi:cell cycle arrest protein BUB3
MDISPGAGAADETPRAVVAMTGRTVHIYEMRALRAACDRLAKDEKVEVKSWEPNQTRESSLKYMVRDVRCMPNGEGESQRANYASRADGRVARV